MVRKPIEKGPRLEALLDERDHLRIKISMAEDRGNTDDLIDMRRKLLDMDREIHALWESPAKGVHPGASKPQQRGSL